MHYDLYFPGSVTVEAQEKARLSVGFSILNNFMVIY